MTLRLTSRIVLFFTLLTAAVLAAVGVFSYRSGSESLRQAAISEMLGSAVEKELAIDTWIGERLADLERLSVNADVVEKAAALVAAEPATEQAHDAHAVLLQELAPYTTAADSGCLEMFVMDPESGAVVASTDPAQEWRSKRGYPYFEQGRTAFYVQPPQHSLEMKAPAMIAAAPLRATGGRVAAVLAVRWNLTPLQAITGFRTGMHQSVDAFLINDEGDPLTQPRFFREPPVAGVPLETEAVRRCIERNSGVAFSADYRGVPSIAVYRWNAKHQFGLIVKIDQAEALTPAHAFGRTVLLISTLALLGTAGLAALLARTITRPLRGLQSSVRRFAEENLRELDVPISDDEVGRLAGEFARMAAQVESKRAALEGEIAERARTEESLRTLQQFQDAMLKSIGQGIHGLDLAGRITFENPASARMLGWEAAELVGQPAHVTMHHHRPDGSCYPVEECRIYATLRDGEFREVDDEVFWRKDGTSFSVEYSVAPLRDASDEITGAVVVFADITERKQAGQALRESEERFRDLFENSSELIQSVGPDGRFIYVNPAWRRALGYEEEEIAALNAFDVICPDHRETCMATFRRLMESEQTINVQTVFVGKDGRQIEVEGHTHCRFKDGHPDATRAIFRDVTERKQAEAALEKANKELVNLSRQAGMSEIATSVLHNVGNVLNSVNVSADLLADHVRKTPVADLSRVVALLREHDTNLGAFFTEDPRGAKVPEFLGKLAVHFSRVQETQLKEVVSLQKNIEHIKEIVAMQQNYARVSGVTERLHVTDLVEDALRMHLGAFQRHEVEVVREFAPGLPAVITEKHKLLQILINLLSNAKYACDGADRGAKPVTVRAAQADGRMRVEVIDTGVGIGPEHLGRIFNLGFTTKKDGHGFGLHSAANAAREMGGSLTVQSDGPGRGATFTLELPCPAQKEAA